MLKVGDIVRMVTFPSPGTEKRFSGVPLRITKMERFCLDFETLDGERKSEGFYHHRFVLDVFLNAAKEAANGEV